MQIRRFVPGEEAALFQIYYSAIHLVAVHDYAQEQIDAWAPSTVDPELWASRIRGINPFVAVIEAEPVGYADVQATGYIDHFFVSGRHPRRGIGRTLMKALESEARRLHLKELTSDVSRTAQPFFEHFGFAVVETRAPVVRGIVVPNAFMRRAL